MQRHALAGHQAADHLEGLLESRDPMVERQAERPELGLVPAGPEPEDEATTADLLDRRGALREERRRRERRAGDERTEVHALRHRGEGREQAPRLPGPAFGTAVAAVQDVIADPDRVEPRGFGGAGQRHVFGPADDALDLRQLDPDAERSHVRHSIRGIARRALTAAGALGILDIRTRKWLSW